MSVDSSRVILGLSVVFLLTITKPNACFDQQLLVISCI